MEIVPPFSRHLFTSQKCINKGKYHILRLKPNKNLPQHSAQVIFNPRKAVFRSQTRNTSDVPSRVKEWGMASLNRCQLANNNYFR